MQTSLRFSPVPTRAWALLLMAILIAVATVAVLAVAGRSPSLPPPFGLAKTGLIAFDANGDVFVAAADGAGVHPLVTSGAKESSPIFSPDGTHVAMWREDGDRLSIVIVRSDGGSPIDVALPAGLHRPVGPAQPAWRPDSTQIAFAVIDPADAEPAIWLVDRSGSDLHRLSLRGTVASRHRTRRSGPEQNGKGAPRVNYRPRSGPAPGIWRKTHAKASFRRGRVTRGLVPMRRRHRRRFGLGTRR